MKPSFPSFRRILPLALAFLLVEFFDELHYGIQSAALPAIRQDLALTYAQVGLLLGLPGVIGTLVEPVIMLLGDSTLRKRLVIGGGIAVAAAIILTAGAQSFTAVLVAFTVSFPASGAFVTLSQATLMDLNPGREPHQMARWTLSGSIGNLVGPVLLAGIFLLGLSWRWAYLGLAVIALSLALSLRRQTFPRHHAAVEEHPPSVREAPRWMAGNLAGAVKNRQLLRWVALLQVSDLLLDVFTSYAALYFADVVGLSTAATSAVLAAIMAASVAADLLLIPLLERFNGRSVVRLSAVLSLVVYSGLLLAPWIGVKIALAVALRFTTIGWYSVLQGEAYAAAPGRSGTVMAVTSLAGLLGGALIWSVGWTAEQAGLQAAMWLLMLGPICLALFTPRSNTKI